MLRGLYRVVAGFGRLVVPLGLFAVIAVGIHAGADRVDDHAMVALNGLDAWVDEVGGAALTWLLTALDFSSGTVERWTFGFVDFVDLEAKDWLARATALVVELVGDVVFAVPLFFHRERGRPFRELFANLRKDPTVLRVVAPLSALLASIAGVLTITRELSVAGYAALEGLDGPARVAELGASAVAGIVLLLVVWRLGARVLARAICWADRVGESDLARSLPARRRRLRGWGVALVVLPVTVLAVAEGVPVLATLRGLFAVG